MQISVITTSGTRSLAISSASSAPAAHPQSENPQASQSTVRAMLSRTSTSSSTNRILYCATGRTSFASLRRARPAQR